MGTIPFRASKTPRRARRALILAVVACVAFVGAAAAAVGGFNPFSTQQVGQTYANGVLLPSNQWVSPLGSRILVSQGRLVSSTISPDGHYLAALSWNDFTGFITIINLTNGTIVGQYENAYPAPDGDGSVAADGPLYSADGTTLYVPQTSDILKFSVDPSTGELSNAATIALPSSSSVGAALPSGMALSHDGGTLYVAFNGLNTLAEIDTSTDTVTNQIAVGNAPRQVVLSADGTTAYVSNEGGRPANTTDFTNLSDGTPIVSDPSTGAAITGTVSVVNLISGQEQTEIPVGLQPTAMYQNGSALFVANSNDDSVSVINEQTNTVSQTVKTNPVPGATVGSYANAINMSDPSHVLVSIGRDNAIAVYSYSGLSTPMRYLGLIPTDWYPVQVQPDPALGAGAIVVTNDKGIGALGPQSTINKGPDTSPATGHNTYDDTGSVTIFTMPTDSQLGADTQTVFTDNDWEQIKPINQGDYDTVPSVIPAHLGGYSPIRHVVVIIRENRTYDQDLGDLTDANGNPLGNGDPADAQFGLDVTPNGHALAQRFGDLDNFYDEGTLSADGHNWMVQAEANDYVEKEFGAFYRSYPSQGGDALAYQRDGFLWNAAEKAGVSVANFGEYIYNPYNLPADAPAWDAWYKESQWLQDGQQGPEPISNPCQYTQVQSDIPSLQAISDPCFPNFQLSIPDQYRVDQWLPQFDSWKQSGKMPRLSFMWLMTDHTTGSQVPDPVAQVADNDLAVGRVVDAISHSRFWRSTAIFIVEDDTQNGVDHVDGHRGPAFVVSPYSAGGVDSQYYTQLDMVKTIEQILGIKPMNQEDLAAEPMYAAFTSHPDFAPYDTRPNQIPLTLGAPGYPSTLTSPPKNATAAERKAFRPEGIVPASMRSVESAWMKWIARQVAEGHLAKQDRVNPEQLNRFDWYSAHNWQVAYPGDPKIDLPDQVPGRNLPAAFIGG